VASHSAVSTLVFVAPEAALPRTLSQIRIDLNPAAFNAVSEEDVAIFNTPEGVTFVDGKCLVSFPYPC
jgi:hypothetical protein